MSNSTVLLLVAAFALVDSMILGAVISAARSAWNPLAAAFPPRTPAPDAVIRRYQSLRLNWCNYGGCIHLAADTGHLHITPARFARWFGARATSIPWDQIRIVKPGPKWIDAKVLSVMLRGPAWCLSLAAPADPASAARP